MSTNREGQVRDLLTSVTCVEGASCVWILTNTHLEMHTLVMPSDGFCNRKFFGTLNSLGASQLGCCVRRAIEKNWPVLLS